MKYALAFALTALIALILAVAAPAEGARRYCPPPLPDRDAPTYSRPVQR